MNTKLSQVAVIPTLEQLANPGKKTFYHAHFFIV